MTEKAVSKGKKQGRKAPRTVTKNATKTATKAEAKTATKTEVKTGAKTKLKRRLILLAPTAAGLLYLGLCFANLQASVWAEESYASYLTRFDFGKIWSLSAEGMQPPLYYFVLKIWRLLFGADATTLRALSAVCGAFAVLTAFLWLKYNYGHAVGILGAFLLAISPVMLRCGTEIRMHTLLILLALATTYVLQIALHHGRKRWWLLYALLAGAGLWTHYGMALVLVAHLVYLAFFFRAEAMAGRQVTAGIVHSARAYGLTLLLFVLWLPNLVGQVNAVANGWNNGLGLVAGQRPSASLLTDFFSESLFDRPSAQITDYVLPLFGTLMLCLTIPAARHRKRLGCLLALATVPPALLTLISLPPLPPVFTMNNLTVTAVVLPLLAGAVTVLLFQTREKDESRTKAIFVATVIIAGALFGLNGFWRFKNADLATGALPAAKDFFHELSGGASDAPIVTDDAEIYFDLSFYASPKQAVYFATTPTEAHGALRLIATDDGASYTGTVDDWASVPAEHFWYVQRGTENTALPDDGYAEELALTYGKGPVYRAVLVRRE